MSLRSVATSLIAMLCCMGLGSAASADTVIIYWDNVALNYIQRDSGPAVASPTLATMHTAMYDAWTAYDPKAVPTRANGILKRPPEEMTDSNKMEAISFAARRTLVYLFPSMASRIDAALAELGYDLEDASNADTATPSGIGNVAASAVVARYGLNRLLGDFSHLRYGAANTLHSYDGTDAWQLVDRGSVLVVQQAAER
jgi:hypothetical protein